MATEDNNTERWLPVVGFEGFYEVSDHGRVRSVGRLLPASGRMNARTLAGRILRPRPSCGGYLGVNISVGGRSIDCKIARLVLSAFVRPPETGEVCNHVDFDRTNNCLSNLEWATQRENLDHSRRAGRMQTGETHWMAKLSDADVRSIRAMAESGCKQRSLAAVFGVTEQTISRVVLRQLWRSV